MHKVWVEEGTDIARELYAAVVLDRGAERLAVMASPSGGMDIEKVAEETPELIFSTRMDPGQPLWDFQCRQLLFGCGLDAGQVRQGTKMLQALVTMAMAKDATLVEINPPGHNGRGQAHRPGRQDQLRRQRPEGATPTSQRLKDPTETDPPWSCRPPSWA